MLMVYLLLIFSIIFIRFFAGYDSRYQNGKYVLIQNSVLRVALLDSMSFFERGKRLKKDRSKMSVCGLLFYIAALWVVIVNIVLLFIPQIPIEPWIIETNKFFMYADTINKKLSAITIWLLLVAVFGYMAYLFIRAAKKIEPKWIKVTVYVVAVMMFVAVALVLLYMLKELFLLFYDFYNIIGKGGVV